MKDGDCCPVCEKGTVFPAKFSMTIEKNNKPIVVSDLEAWQCDKCGERSMETRQLRANNAKVLEARNNV